MLTRFSLTAVVVLILGGVLIFGGWAFGQTAADEARKAAALKWHPAGERPSGSPETHAPAADTPRVASSVRPGVSRSSITRVTNGDGTLPNEHGQVWREYDISPYTIRVTTTKHPEQAIIDWILQETGYEMWHGEPLGILSATPRTLRVYHTPKIQAVVANAVDRFVASEAVTSSFSLRIVTLDHPNWRTRAQRLLHPVKVRTPGINAWLLEKEEAAVLLAELRRRSDYREHSSSHLLVNNGQPTVVSGMRGRDYVRDVILQSEAWPGYKTEMGQVDEGFLLELSPLLSTDRRLIDATIKFNIDQVEKMIPVMLDVPTVVAPRQQAQIEVPQITHFRFHERFRWPTDKVLLVGMGMVALPVPVSPKSKSLVPGLPLSLSSPMHTRADLLVLIEAKPKAVSNPRLSRTLQR